MFHKVNRSIYYRIVASLMKTNVTIVVPNWDGKDYIGVCLRSLFEQNLEADIIVVDNGSVDGSVDYIKKNFTGANVIELKTNTGFAGGVNRGIEYAIKHGADYVALFNNDAVADKNWLKRLVEAANNHPRAGIVTGKLMRSDKKHIDSTADILSIHGLPFPRGRNEVDHGQYDKPEYVFGASGGASLYRASMLKEIGLFDEDFFAYFEDVDISFRAQLAGWKVYYEPEAIAYHEVGATSSRMGSFSRYHSVKNIILLYNKNMPGHLFWKYKLLLFMQLARMKIGALRDKQFGAYLSGFFKGLSLMPSTFAKRRKIQKSRVVSVKDIDKLLFHGRPPRPPKIGEIK